MGLNWEVMCRCYSNRDATVAFATLPRIRSGPNGPRAVTLCKNGALTLAIVQISVNGVWHKKIDISMRERRTDRGKEDNKRDEKPV